MVKRIFVGILFILALFMASTFTPINAQTLETIAESGSTIVNGQPFNGAFLHPIQNSNGDVAFYGTTGGNLKSGIFLYSNDAKEFLSVATFSDPNPRDPSKKIAEILFPAFLSKKRSVLFGGFPLSSNTIDFRTVYLWKDHKLSIPLAIGDEIPMRRLKNKSASTQDIKKITKYRIIRIIFVSMNDRDQICYSASLLNTENNARTTAVITIIDNEHRIVTNTEDLFDFQGFKLRYFFFGRVLVNANGDIAFYAMVNSEAISQLILTYSFAEKDLLPIARNGFVTDDDLLIIKIEPDDFNKKGAYLIKATAVDSSNFLQIQYYLLKPKDETRTSYEVIPVIRWYSEVAGRKISEILEATNVSANKIWFLVNDLETGKPFFILWDKGQTSAIDIEAPISVSSLANHRFGNTNSTHGAVFTGSITTDSFHIGIYRVKLKKD